MGIEGKSASRGDCTIVTRILLVEDDSGSRTATCRALELRGAVVDAVPNALTVLAAYSQMRPDAMVLDIGLPGQDGYSLILRLRSIEATQQLIAALLRLTRTNRN